MLWQSCVPDGHENSRWLSARGSHLNSSRKDCSECCKIGASNTDIDSVRFVYGSSAICGCFSASAPSLSSSDPQYSKKNISPGSELIFRIENGMERSGLSPSLQNSLVAFSCIGRERLLLREPFGVDGFVAEFEKIGEAERICNSEEDRCRRLK